MGKENLITALKLIEKDLIENYASYDETRLQQVVSQFQGKVLKIRQKEQSIHDNLQALSLEDLNQVIDDINLNLLSRPEPKNKLVSLLNSLIVQEGKETDLLQVINKFNFLRKTYKKPSSNEISPDEYDDLREEWLACESPEELTLEMGRMKLNDLRAVVEPWKIKSRSKEEFIDLTIDYIKTLKGLST